MNVMEKILVADDEKNYRHVLSTLLEKANYEVLTAASGNEAYELFLGHEIDLILTDMTMPGGSGLDLLNKVKEKAPETPVILLTAYGTVELAVEAMKMGAFDYLTKPCPNEEVLRSVSKALEVGRLEKQNKNLRSALTKVYSFGNLIGKSKPMLNLYTLLEKVAPTKANILITGESGTGKELVAAALHYNSPRADHPFVAVNCSALSASLLESELFGHEKGAFTDAKYSRPGRFEMAHSGTLFLDEVGEMDPSIQVKLLRVLQERTFERVGGTTPIKVDVRLVTATNRDLKQEVAAGRFREDLFYRLNVVHLLLPPLRERLDDLPLLVEHFLNKYAEENKSPLKISREALRLLYNHNWPGNVRELENVIERGVVLALGEEITENDLPEEFKQNTPNQAHLSLREVTEPARNREETENEPKAAPALDWLNEAHKILPPEITLNEAIGALEEGLLKAALKDVDGVQSQAAMILGLKKNVFKYKWDKYQDLETHPLAHDLAQTVPGQLPLADALDQFEEFLIKKALARHHGVQSHAADSLGIKKNLMQYKLKKFNLKPEDNYSGEQ